MTKRRIETSGAPAPVGPYSQAIDIGDLVFLAGQVGVDPQTGELVEGGVEAETDRAMRNLREVLDAAGLAFADVVKSTIFLADMGDFAQVNAIYGRAFDDAPPARSTFAVVSLPKGARVEIEMIAARPGTGSDV